VEAAKVVLPLSGPSPVPLATHVRGTVLVSSQRSLEARGLSAQYQKTIPAAFRDALTLVVAPSWIPMEVGLAHYWACDRMDLTLTDIQAIGRESGKFIYSATVVTVLRMSAQFGSTPWAVFGNLNRFSARTWDGGAGFEVRQVAQKEAEIHWHGQPCAVVPYFQHAFGAFLCGCIEPLCRTAYYRMLKPPAGTYSLGYRVSWV
jgi:hypothetical protein